MGVGTGGSPLASLPALLEHSPTETALGVPLLLHLSPLSFLNTLSLHRPTLRACRTCPGTEGGTVLSPVSPAPHCALSPGPASSSNPGPSDGTGSLEMGSSKIPCPLSVSLGICPTGVNLTGSHCSGEAGKVGSPPPDECLSPVLHHFRRHLHPAPARPPQGNLPPHGNKLTPG